MMKFLSAGVLASGALAGAAGAATLSGTFNVAAVHLVGLDSTQSEATLENFNSAVAGTLDPSYVLSSFTYEGALDFRQADVNSDNTTIYQWLQTGSGFVDPLDIGPFGGLQMSSPDIDTGTARTTFFLFQLANLGAADFTITHDDGVAVLDDGVVIGGFAGPNSERTTQVSGFGGGKLGILYVATNGDPSVLEVELTPVPVAATLPLLLARMGGLAFLRRRAGD